MDDALNPDAQINILAQSDSLQPPAQRSRYSPEKLTRLSKQARNLPHLTAAACLLKILMSACLPIFSFLKVQHSKWH